MKNQKKKSKKTKQGNAAKVSIASENKKSEKENNPNILNEETKPGKEEAGGTEINEKGPEKGEPSEAEINEAKSDTIKSNTIEIDKIKSDKAELNKAEQNEKAEKIEAEKIKEKSPAGEKGKKHHKKRIIAIITVMILLIVFVMAYGGIAIYYQSHFLPNMFINDIDCSNLDAQAAAGILEEQAAGYTLELVGRTEDGKQETLGKIQAEDIDLVYTNILVDVTRILDSQNSWLWFQAYLNRKDSVKEKSVSLISGVDFQKEKLQDFLGKLDAFQTKNVKAPKDAYISEYSEKIKGYEIIPEVMGTQLDPEAVISVVEAAIYANDTDVVDLYEQGCYVQPEVTAKDEKLLDKCNTLNKWVGAEIVYDWNGNEVIVNADQIHEWIIFDSDKPKLDKEKIIGFVKENAKEFDTYGRKRKFVTTLGVELTLPGGAYGWKTDSEGEAEELIQAIESGKKVKKEPLFISKGAKKGSNDIGSSYVEADLSNQHLYLYQNGTVVLETDFVSGNMSNGCTTPPGVFGITYKTTNAVLRGADYVTPVQYWMPFNGNVGMHDATWRSEFGGDIFLENGSHGCINLPLDMAEAIYGYMSTGFPVICYYY